MIKITETINVMDKSIKKIGEIGLYGKTLNRFMRALHMIRRAISIDVNIHLTQKGLEIFQIDTTKASMIHLTINKFDFTRFEIDQDLVLSVNINEILNNVPLSALKNDSELKITINGQIELDLNDGEYTHSFGEIDPGGIIEKEIDINKLDLQYEITMEAIELQDKLKLLKKQNYESVSFISEKGDLYLYSKSETKSGKTKLKLINTFHVEDRLNSTYSIAHLDKLFSKQNSLFLKKRGSGVIQEDIKLHIGNDQPLYFEITDQNMKIIYVLAPQAEEEEEYDDWEAEEFEDL